MKKYTSTHQVFIKLYIKKNTVFSNYVPTIEFPNKFNEEDVDLVIDKTVKNLDFKKLELQKGRFESTDEWKYPQDSEDGGIIILDDSNAKAQNDPRVQAMLKRSGHNILPIFIISHEYYEKPKRTIWANGNIYHIFEPNNFRDVNNLSQDKKSIYLTFNEIKYLTSTCWNEKYQFLTIDITKDKYTGRYRLGLDSLFVPDTKPFWNVDI